jgi:hypothetical protein
MKRIGMRVASNPEQPELDWPDGGGVSGVIENGLALSFGQDLSQG